MEKLLLDSIRKTDEYVISNLRNLEMIRYKLLLWSLGYNSSFHYLKEVISETLELNIFNLNDNHTHMTFVSRYRRYNFTTIFTPKKYLKKMFFRYNKDILNIVNLIMINYTKVETNLSNLEYLNYLNENLKVLEYTDLRYRRLKFHKTNNELKLYKFIKLELKKTEDLIKLESRNIKYKKYLKYKFIEDESLLNSLSIELEKTGFINNASDFLEFFTGSKEIPYIVTAKKINWNRGLVSLAYLFIRMTEIGFLNAEILSKINVKISGLFTYGNNQPIDNKVMGNAKNRIGLYLIILEGKSVPAKNSNLMIIYRILEKLDLNKKT